MEVRKCIYLIFLQMLHLSSICDGQINCQVEKQYSGEIYYSSQYSNKKCWKIEVPENNNLWLNVKELITFHPSCGFGSVKITVSGTGDEFRYCGQNTTRKPIIALNDVKITYFTPTLYSTSFRIVYNKKNLICTLKDNFRCSNDSCIHQHQVCDGVKDCENGADEKKCESLICTRKDHFQCSNHYCIHPHQVCDGVKDCENGADEKECDKLICTLKDHFRCSNHSCIHQHQVCDGIKDCENGGDEKECETGIAAVSGVNISRENSIKWLRGQRSVSFGWGKNTHRAITALYLAGVADFRGDNMEEELMAKQLELQTSVAVLRNSTDPLSVSDLSMFINALTVTCHNPRQFYGYDLLQILEERVITSNSPSPGAYLTLCIANLTFSQVHVQSLLRILQKHSEYPFHLDVHAMTIMALSCVKNKTKDFKYIKNASKLYNSTVQKFIDAQLRDGSFGNVYTTGVVIQALLASGQENNKLWNLNSTVKYLMKELNTSADFLSTYLALPIFSGKSLVDIANVNCTNLRKHGEDDEIYDVTNKLGGKVRIQYSLYVGDQKDVIHTMYMRVPENSSAYEVMRLAQVVDYKYKFQHRDVAGHMYVYAIAGITNDPEAGKFWLLYTGDSHINGTVHHHTKSPDKFILGDGEHLIMWYKTVHI